jgi:hypothetical protein
MGKNQALHDPSQSSKYCAVLTGKAALKYGTGVADGVRLSLPLTETACWIRGIGGRLSHDDMLLSAQLQTTRECVLCDYVGWKEE